MFTERPYPPGGRGPAEGAQARDGLRNLHLVRLPEVREDLADLISPRIAH